MNALFAFFFGAGGAFALWKAVRAVRTGRIVSHHWGSRRTSLREDDSWGFNAVILTHVAGGLGFLALAARVLST